MARIKNIELPSEKHTVIGLTAIYGIGRNLAKTICEAANVETTKKVKDLLLYIKQGDKLISPYYNKVSKNNTFTSLAVNKLLGNEKINNIEFLSFSRIAERLLSRYGKMEKKGGLNWKETLHFAIQIPGHGTLFTGGLGMEIHDDGLYIRRQSGNDTLVNDKPLKRRHDSTSHNCHYKERCTKRSIIAIDIL